MSERRIYLDYNATAPLRRGARVAMTAALGLAGNASSVHQEGRLARTVVERARGCVAALLDAAPAEVVFTSGGTESNNWLLGAGWDVIFIAGIEHDSVLAQAKSAAAAGLKVAADREPTEARSQGGGGTGRQIVTIPVDGDGVIDLDALAELFDQHLSADVAARHGDAPASGHRRLLLSLQMANNETGVVQPLAEAVALAKARGIFVHSDAVQAVGRLPLSFKQLGADFLTVSSHKIGGPQGTGALLIAEGLEVPQLIVGGGQERNWRAGTENVAAIAGFGSAAEAVTRELASVKRLEAMRDELEREIVGLSPRARIIGAKAPRLANTTCVAVPGFAAETLVIKFDLDGIALSAGSACSSGKVGASHVLQAMGLEDELSRAAIRISLGWGTTSDDIEAFLECWKRNVLDPSTSRAARQKVA